MPVPTPTLAVMFRSVACGSADPSVKDSSWACALVCPLQSEWNCVSRGGTTSFKPTQCHLDVWTPCEAVVQTDVGDDRWLVPFIDFKVACSTSLPLPLGAQQ